MDPSKAKAERADDIQIVKNCDVATASLADGRKEIMGGRRRLFSNADNKVTGVATPVRAPILKVSCARSHWTAPIFVAMSRHCEIPSVSSRLHFAAELKLSEFACEFQ